MTADPHEMPDERARRVSGLSVGPDGYRALFEHVDAMACILDPDGRFAAVNPAGERLTGYRADELLGRFATEVIAPEHHEEAVRRFRRRLHEAGDMTPDESVLVTKSGERLPIEVRSVQVLEGGKLVGVLGLVRDLSGTRQLESALRDADERFQGFFQHAPVGQAVCAPDGRWLDVNPALCSFLGRTREELDGVTWQDLTHPDDLEADLAQAGRLLAGEIESYQLEKRFLHRDGRPLPALLTVSLVRDVDGTPAYGIAHVLDLSVTKRAQEARTLSESRLAEAQQLARIGSWEWDLERDAVDWSDELYRIYGLEHGAELTYESYVRTIHPGDRAVWKSAVHAAIESGEAYSLEHRIVLPDGSVRWVHGRGQVELRDGRAVRMRGTAQDVTERREAELRLREAEERYRNLVEQLPLVTYVRPLDMPGSNLFVSPQVEEMLGYPAEAWLEDGDLLAGIVHPDDLERVLADGERVRETGEPSRHEYRYLRPDGEVVWVLDETHLLRDRDGAPIAVQGFLVDVTERKRAEEERDRLLEALHHAQKLEALGRLAGGVAHDFNNMLTAIKGYAELLLESLPSGARGRAEAEQIRRAAEQAAILPKQLLAFGRKQELQARVVDLDRTLADASELLTRMGTEAVDVVVVPGARGASVVVDPRQLEQALMNLALNGRDAMPEGGTITVSSWVADVGVDLARKHDVVSGSYAIVSVADTGVGMDEDTRARAFEPFFTTKSNGDGTGLGLSMVYGFVAQTGGFVEVQTAPGAGTRFDIYLPLAISTLGSGLDSSDEDAAGRHAGVVVLVEDEDVVRDVARATLERAGYAVVDAPCADDALTRLERGDVDADVLVSDMVMPGMGGSELARRFRELRPGAPVILMSGYTDELDALDTASTFLQKPFSPGDLVAAVNDALNANRRADNGHTRRLTCLVADDHPAVLDSVSRFLEHQGIEVVAAVARGDEAIAEVASRRPALALLDVSMQPMSGIDVARRIAEETPATRTILYTGYRDTALLEQALDAGARGFVLKEGPLSELVRALEVVDGGGTYVDPELSGALAQVHVAAPSSPLTPREREVLALLADGLTNEKAAAELGISAETIQSHVGNAMAKLEADTRTEAVATAIRQSLIA